MSNQTQTSITIPPVRDVLRRLHEIACEQKALRIMLRAADAMEKIQKPQSNQTPQK